MHPSIDRQSFFKIARDNIRNYSMFLMLALITIAFSFITNGINLNARNITNIFIQNSYILTLAVGMVLVIITGNIDLSVGSVCAFVGALSAMIYNLGVGMIVTIASAIVIGLCIGGIQGFFIAFLKVPAFIVTLAGMLLYRGLTYIITQVSPVSLADDRYKQIASGFSFVSKGEFHTLAFIVAIGLIFVFIIYSIFHYKEKTKHGFHVLPIRFLVLKLVIFSAAALAIGWQFSTYRGIPNVVILLLSVILIFVFITNQTVLGREIYAVGGNAKAAKLSGVNSERIIFLVFAIMGGLAGLAGVIFTGYLNSALPQSGQLFELEAIAAVFIGGASAAGGIGTVMGAITGGLVMGVINNGMSLINLGAEYQYVVKALVLLFAVWYDQYTRNKGKIG